MKKLTFLTLACALFMGLTATAQETTPNYTFNKFSDNWFIQAEGGAGVLLSKDDGQMNFADRVGWKGELSVGKWFTPIIATRISANFSQHHGIANPDYSIIVGERWQNNRVEQQFNTLGLYTDVMINLTNWWCGYRPGRIYNASLYAGLGLNIVFAKNGTVDNAGNIEYGDWKFQKHTTIPGFRAGLLNSIRLNNHWDFLLDLRIDAMFKYVDGYGQRSDIYSPSVLVGFNYKFNKTDWTAPGAVTCPTYKYTDAEGDALVARLAAADAKIASLEKQLNDCLNRKIDVLPPPVEITEGPLATIYFPIGKSTITREQKKVVEAIANVMNDNDKNYVLTGWADNYTGSDKINAKLRKDRVNGVKNALNKLGVAEGRLDAQINDGNLTNFGAKSAALDRAVTVNEAK